MKRILCLFVMLVMVLSSAVSCEIDPKAGRYKDALALIESGDYEAARTMLVKLGDYKDAKELLGNFRYVLLTEETDSFAADGREIGKYVYTYTYSDDGRLLSWVMTNETYEFVYDENRNLIQIRRTTSEGTGLYNEYAYDEKGQLIKETSYTGTMPLSGYEYTYDDEGNVIRKVSLYNDHLVLPYMQVRYTVENTYDEENRLTSAVMTWSGGSVDRVNYIYDESGKLIREEKPTDEGPVVLVEYTYDERGNLLKEARESYTVEWTYDQNGNLIKHWQYDTQYSAAVEFLHEYTYDQNGNLLKEQSTYNNERVLVTVEYTYDESGNLQREHKEVKERKDLDTYTYVYDENGNVIEYTKALSNGRTDTSKMTYKLVYISYNLHEYVERIICSTFH